MILAYKAAWLSLSLSSRKISRLESEGRGPVKLRDKRPNLYRVFHLAVHLVSVDMDLKCSIVIPDIA